MTATQLISLFKNAGFITSMTADNVGVLVSLKNHTVDAIEAQLVLGDRRNKIIRSGNGVMIMPLTIKIR